MIDELETTDSEVDFQVYDYLRTRFVLESKDVDTFWLLAYGSIRTMEDFACCQGVFYVRGARPRGDDYWKAEGGNGIPTFI